MAKLSTETQKNISDLKDRFPVARSAVLPALHYAQAELGFLDDETLVEVADLLGVTRNMTSEVVGFYTMFDRKKPGTYKLEVCKNLSCALMGAKKMVSHIEAKLGIKSGETTTDGKFTLLEVECLGACGYAPMMMIGPYFYECLTREQVGGILDALQKDQKPPVTPAGYLDMDNDPPPKGKDSAIPTASQDIRDHELMGAGGGAGGAGP